MLPQGAYSSRRARGQEGPVEHGASSGSLYSEELPRPSSRKRRLEEEAEEEDGAKLEPPSPELEPPELEPPAPIPDLVSLILREMVNSLTIDQDTRARVECSDLEADRECGPQAGVDQHAAGTIPLAPMA